MEQEKISFDERIHASAVRFLIQENEKDAAIALLACTFELSSWGTNFDRTEYSTLLQGPRWIYEVVHDENHPTIQAIHKALNAVMPWDGYVKHVWIKANLIDIEPDWKAQMLDIALGKEAHNQGVTIQNRATMMWRNLRFRSESEKRIAQVLDEAGVLFLPNCLAGFQVTQYPCISRTRLLIWFLFHLDGANLSLADLSEAKTSRTNNSTKRPSSRELSRLMKQNTHRNT